MQEMPGTKRDCNCVLGASLHDTDVHFYTWLICLHWREQRGTENGGERAKKTNKGGIDVRGKAAPWIPLS